MLPSWPGGKMTLPAQSAGAMTIGITNTITIAAFGMKINTPPPLAPAGPADVPSAFIGHTQRHDGPHPDLKVKLLFS